MHTERVYVQGNVQGVGFRVFVHRLALTHGIRGVVWNTVDGAVGILAQHEDPEVLYGPFMSGLVKGPGLITKIICSAGKSSPEYHRFEIGHTRRQPA